MSLFRDQDAVDRLRGHNSLVVGHRQVPQLTQSRSQSVIPSNFYSLRPHNQNSFNESWKS